MDDIPKLQGTKLLHTTGLRYKVNTKVKKVKSKRNLHDTPLPPESRPSTSSTSTVSFATPPSNKRVSIVPLVSTDILAQDAHMGKERRKKMRRANSSKKIMPGVEKETTFVYEEKELKLAVCCVIS